MNHSDFVLGGAFWCAGHAWRCTDIGSRVIIAIRLDHDDDPSWYDGPPYAVAESVFDENDFAGCALEPVPVSAPGTAAGPEALDGVPDERPQARALRIQAREGGLRFDAYLPSQLADWLLDMIERGIFRDPSEAVFVILGEHRALQPHQDLRDEMFRRSIQTAIDDPRPGIPSEEIKAIMQRMLAAPRPEPAQWRRVRS